MSAYDTIVAGLAGSGLILLGFITTQGTSDFHLNGAQVEQELTRQAQTALVQAGHDWAAVSFVGQSATVSGDAPDQASIDQAAAIVLESAGMGGYLWGGVTGVKSIAEVKAMPPVVETYRPEPPSPDNTVSNSEETDQGPLVENREGSE